MSKFKDLVTSVKVGARVKDLGTADEVVIRYKDLFISLLVGEDGEIKSMGWSDNPGMFQVPVRDFWQAVPPEVTGQLAGMTGDTDV